MRKLLALLTVATLAMGLSPGQAFHADDLPLIASADDQPSGWVSFRLGIDGSTGALDVGTLQLNGPTQLGFALYDEAGAALGAFVFTAFPGKQGQQIDLLPPDGPVHVDEVTDNNIEGLMALGTTFNDPEFVTEPFVGTLQVVLWWAGNSTFSWAVRGDDGFSIDGRDAAARAWLYDSDDFASLAYAQAHQTNENIGSVGAHAQLQGDQPLEVENALIGFYAFGLSAAGSLTMTTPTGERSCDGLVVASSGFIGGSSCFFLNLQGAGAMGPGEYVLHATSAGAGYTGAFEDIWFGGADARLPA